jgi:Type IV secretion system pilin
MIKKLQISIATLLATFGLMAGVAMPVVAAQGVGNLCSGAQGNITGADNATSTCKDTGADGKINNAIKFAIRIFQTIVGLIAVFMVITGGLKYITSGGDSGGVTGAKNTILYAVIGLVVVALAEIVVQFVLNRVASNAI